jgi:hypothetical protein
MLLECWTVDTVTARNTTDSTIGVPRKQERSQLRLQQMAEEFRESTFKLPNGDRHERVRHILELRNNRRYSHSVEWIYVAGRVVEYESIGADDSATQTVMVIIQEVRKPNVTQAIPRPRARTRSNEDLRRPAANKDTRKSPHREQHPNLRVAIETSKTTQVIPIPVLPVVTPPNHGTRAIPYPLPRHQDGLLSPRPTGIVRVVSDPGRKPQVKVTPASSPSRPTTPSDVASVATTNTKIKRIRTDGRCKWGAKCRTLRCPNKHPPLCRLDDKCGSLACYYQHRSMVSCPSGSDCRREHCNNDHGRRQCKQNPCTDDNCAMRHCAGQKAVIGWWAIQRID